MRVCWLLWDDISHRDLVTGRARSDKDGRGGREEEGEWMQHRGRGAHYIITIWTLFSDSSFGMIVIIITNSLGQIGDKKGWVLWDIFTN